jgi:hypothetical protein
MRQLTSRDFAYWLQGFYEVGKPTSIDENQTELIRKHLNMVFVHEIDPSFPAEQREKLANSHSTTTSSKIQTFPNSVDHGTQKLPPDIERMC